ncbi:type II toxin-antitoxin system antitoxin, RelB/DinJ family [Suicoccus acidiformans]|uniref:Type II toxin-antitoxin system antitoxin, RelB/DinJ family n=1 Tax=Suicoccus acidiformans TaxID=2036206 RepID=A0A347WKV1_9LACT|nr:type II toxin-antitoxin system RelB/DinJ family antitoxin [Suicoccus acidiformans]AXY25708.1 type II toxin-antitoxin system antitoxin, RelB/DinJ family [Suicoccus acidiformans]
MAEVQKERLSINVDKATKDEAMALFEELGMSLTTAVNLFLKQSLRERALPFRVSLQNSKVTDKYGELRRGKGGVERSVAYLVAEDESEYEV